MTDPIVGEYREGDSRSGEVSVRPTADGPETIVLVRQVGSTVSWSVLNAVTESIDVTDPSNGELVSSPVAVAGRALAFEGHVNVEVRADGSTGAIGAGFVTGGGDVMRDFSASIPFETPGSRYGAIVFTTRSAEDGRVMEATTVRVAFVSTDIDAAACAGYQSPRPQLAAGEMEVKAYFNCDASDDAIALHPVYRAVPASPAVLDASLVALLSGPTAEEQQASLSSWFSAATKDALRGVTITNAHAVVDFVDLRRLIPNASSSAGSERLLSQLDATVFQFSSVRSVEYRLDGSCADFNEWLQYGGCEPRVRGTSTD
jgi:hypothetical protein